MYLAFQQKLSQRIREFLKQSYGVEIERLVMEQPPKVELGEYATPIAFELAKRLRKPPRKIAEEIVAGLGTLDGFGPFEVAGAGYINARLNRGAAAKVLLQQEGKVAAQPDKKALVEHTSINPNKAAHIGHLRNAILGDTFVRLLRASGVPVDVQNYIDNTGVQVADVVVGFQQLEKKSLAEVEAIIAAEPRFDYYCWDLYARTNQWYEQNRDNKKFSHEALQAIEAGGNDTARMAEIISTAVLRRHLETMLRLGILYDFLPRESEILHLHFWDLAFEQLKQKGVLYHETEGKNKGCWVMKRASTAKAEAAAKLEEGEAVAAEGPDEDAKVIVRSNGTVTYVGKDIAYHLWKFGLLGRDFGYRKFFHYPADKKRDVYPEGHECWISAESGEAEHPHFGGVSAIYNVIDSRQSDPQNNVIEALRGLGYTDAANRYTHFSYEKVALTPACAAELGYTVSEEDRSKPFMEVSGRKGFGVKADDLLDALIAAAQKEVDARQENMQEGRRREVATQIAVGALRYFMLKYTKNSVIAFDFKEALAFEGESGPYALNAVVRATSILRKACMSPKEVFDTVANDDFSEFLAGEEGTGIWELWLMASKLGSIVEQCIATSEPAYLAKYVFQLAQAFHSFYHKHHILTEESENRKHFLLAAVAVVRRELVTALGMMGITVPAVM